MSTPYSGNAANATGDVVSTTTMDDGDALNAAGLNPPIKSSFDWLQRIWTLIGHIFTASNTWTGSQHFTTGVEISGDLNLDARIILQNPPTPSALTVAAGYTGIATVISVLGFSFRLHVNLARPGSRADLNLVTGGFQAPAADQYLPGVRTEPSGVTSAFVAKIVAGSNAISIQAESPGSVSGSVYTLNGTYFAG